GVEQGAARGASALGDLASQAQATSESLREVEAAGDGVARSAAGAGQQSFALASQFGELSQAAVDAYMAVNQFAGTFLFGDRLNAVTAEIRAQKKALAERTESLRNSMAEFDELESRRQELRRDYGLLADSQIDQV